MKMILMAVLAILAGPAFAQSVDNSLPWESPYAHCRDLGEPHRFLCMILSSAHRDPKECVEIGQNKIVPQSASCESNRRASPADSFPTREKRSHECSYSYGRL